MTGAWVKSLPLVLPRKDPRAYGELALLHLVNALANERTGSTSLLREVQLAAAHVRAWRTSLPKNKQSERVEDGGDFYSNRQLIGMAIHNIIEADDEGEGHWLRYSEAYLRTVGKRLAKENS